MVVAVLGALASIAATIITAVIAWRSAKQNSETQTAIAATSQEAQQRIAEFNAAQQQRIAELDAAQQQRIAEFNAVAALKLEAYRTETAGEVAARRAYEYEARKRLYTECEPLLFQLLDRAEGARIRIAALARTAREQNLPRDLGTTGQRGYYLRFAVFSLLSPLAAFQLIQRRLTRLDMTLDRTVAHEYELSWLVYYTFSAHLPLARVRGNESSRPFALDYDPFNEQWQELRVTDPAKYWIQGLPAGRLEAAAEALTALEDGERRLLSFGEFEALYLAEPPGSVFQRLKPAMDMFFEFHPRTRPVLWRSLCSQVLLYRALLSPDFAGIDSPEHLKALVLRPLTKEEVAEFDWRSVADPDVPDKAIIEPFEAAGIYLADVMRRSSAFSRRGRNAVVDV